MHTERSASSILPWIWVIEALARMKEVDISVLTDLVVKTPEVADDVGKDVRDILSLRILEDFQVQQHGNLNDSFTGPTPNIEIGRSTDQEDALRLLLQKISLFTVRKEESETLMSDLQNYIQNRRCSLPKCALEQLEVAIQEGHPILESLKQSSRLSTNNLSANITSLNGSLANHEAWSNAVPQKVKQTVHGGRVVSMQGNLDLSQSTSLQDPIMKNHISSRCKGIDPASKDKFREHLNDRNSPKGDNDPHLRIAKKAKHDDLVKNKATDKLLTAAMVSNELLENVIETGSKMSVVSKVDKQRSKEVGHDLCSGNNDFSKEEDDDPTVGPSVCSLHDKTEKECANNLETDGDSDGFDNEKIDIEIRKQRFLSSQCTFSEDALSTTQKTELNLCIKCNKDGQLLVCSTRTCMIGLHPSCLGYAVSLDDCRHFYCPFCSYSNAISEHLEAKKMLSLSRNSLIASMRFENESQPTIDSKRDRQQKKPLESRVDGNQPFEDKHVGSESETEHNWRGEHITEKHDCQQAHTNLCKELVVYAKQGKQFVHRSGGLC